jgi:glycosyltransferase involved in cell wall biosynthesis
MLEAVKKHGSCKLSVEPIRIDPVSGDAPRPLWSVMIPTYNCAEYLRQTIQSVLAQDPGANRMQIEVLDDCSTKDDPEAVVRDVGKGRVGFYRKPKNEGAVANFNACLQRSRGQLVHILHGDDYVLPGFYEAIDSAQNLYPDIALIASRCFFVDQEGHLTGVSPRLPSLETPGRSIDDFFYETPVQCAGVVGRRSFYENNGGFRPDLPHAADTERWACAIKVGGGVVLPQVLAAYRVFPGNDTGRLMRSAENLRDREKLIEIFSSHEPTFNRKKAMEMMLNLALYQYDRFHASGDEEAAHANLQFWCDRMPSYRRLKRMARLFLTKLETFFNR